MGDENWATSITHTEASRVVAILLPYYSHEA